MRQSLEAGASRLATADLRPDVGLQQQTERWSELAVDRLVVADQQAAEEHLVELPSDLRLGNAVGAVAVGHQCQGVIERRQHLSQSGVGVFEVLLGGCQCLADTCLLGLQHVERQCAGVVGLQQLLALVEQLAVALLLLGPLGSQLLMGLLELCLQMCPQRFGHRRCQADGLVLALNEVFHDVDRQCALRAVGAPLLPTEADEVLVAGAVAVSFVINDEPAAALAAEDAALEIVVVEPRLLAGVPLGGQHVLHGLPQLGRHQRFVPTGVFDAAVAHETLVVGVLEQPGQVTHDERLARTGLRRPGG